MNKLWKCPKCHREFAKNNQSHSCTIYTLDKHFERKDYAKKLFDFLVGQINKNIGPIKIESLPCCIHLVSSYTFGGVWALKDRIRIDFRLAREIETRKKHKVIKISKNRYLYYFDLKNQKEIDNELIVWLKEAYRLNVEK
jgi:predicted nucleic-acid-binding Zn-ribbon protein